MPRNDPKHSADTGTSAEKKRRSLLRALPLLGAGPSVGGQAVMEGVMMRNQDVLAVAVRKSDGNILVETWPWFSLTRAKILKKPFVRGFPVLLETLVNGIKALNFSATQAVDEEEDGGEIKPWHLVLTMVLAIGLALGLFVVVPHFLSWGMQALGLGGDMKGISFHIWDGFFKLAIFLGYIAAISMVPDIRRVFQYHGAEHKAIWAYEEEQSLNPDSAKGYSRLHPRCGTTFLLFVLSIAIVLHIFLVPPILRLYAPETAWVKHLYVTGMKLFFMVPISCLAYEAIKFAGKYRHKFFGRLMSCPGLFLQMLTTKEPDKKQLEVAVAALAGALGTEAAEAVGTNAANNTDT